MNINIDQLAGRIAGKLDIDQDTAEAVARNYLEQCGPESTEDSITPDDADVIVDRAVHAKASGDLGAQALDDLSVIVRHIEQLTAARDPAIRRALDAGAKTADVCSATGLSRQRIHDIRKSGRAD